MNRREFLGAGTATAVATSSNFFALDAFAENPTGYYKSIHKPLDHFVEQYLRAMNTWTLTKASVRLHPINAMQGYRPNPVAQYAIQLMRAQRGGKELPVAPEIRAATYMENVADFAGAYHSVDGR